MAPLRILYRLDFGHLVVQFWKRREKMLSLQWGTVSFEESEVERPGTCTVLPLFGSRDQHVSHRLAGSSVGAA
jgi:hypothetical protein